MMPQWTQKEISILREHYPLGGVRAVTALLPGRTVSAIVTRASELQIKVRKRVHAGRPRRYERSPELDERIRKLYSAPVGDGQVKAFAQREGLPRWWVCRRAIDLGVKVPRKKEPAWSDEELQLLEETAHLTVRVAARRFKKRGFNRSETSIHVRRKRMHVQPSDNGYYTASQLAQLLGVNSSTVADWCERGWLRSKRRGTERTAQQGGDHWWIRENDLREFIAVHPMRIDHRKLPASSWLWFVEVLAGKARL